ncbi:MAG: MATE family efflux transporter [Desulfomonilaceae bacterium]|nr:MATE family efflux transporter [Desulfomonilaceae bacterium]
MKTSVHYNFDEVKRFLAESWSMGWPMILIMFFHFSIGMADVYVAGYLGTNVLAAVGYVGQLYWTLLIVANGITVGAVSMISQAYGANSSEGVSRVTAHSLVLGIAISGVLTAFALAFPSSIVRIAGMPGDIRDIAEDFIRIFSLVLIPTYVMVITSGVLRASGRIHVAMINSLVASVVNIAGDLILGFGWGPIPALGYKGIAWATAAGTTLGMVLNLVFILRGPSGLRLSCLLHPLPRCMKNLARLGVPSALQQTAWNAGTLVVYFLVGQLRGGEITALAAMTAGVRIEALIFLPIFALNMACAVLTGNKLGAGDEAGARYGAKVVAALSLTIILLPVVAVFVFAPQISSWLTQDRAVIDEMVRYLRINMVGMPFLAIGISLSGALQGAGDTMATMRIVFTGMWLFRIPFILAIIHVFRFSATGVWWAMTLSMILMCGLLANRFRGDTWVKASFDKESNSMLWEACVPKKPVV